LLLAGLIAAAVLASPGDARSGEAEATHRPTASVWVLSAPHTGKKICEVPTSTPIRLINWAKHGPHPYARIEVLEGDCAGTQGYVPSQTLEPEPRED
jgi:hypothetical protein